jgi:membrane-associated phospholipid phosphatase
MTQPSQTPPQPRRHRTVARVPLVAWTYTLATVALAALSVRVWHSHDATSWEVSLTSFLRRHPVPLPQAIGPMTEVAALGLVTFVLAFFAAISCRPRLAVSGSLACIAAVAFASFIMKPVVARHHLHGGALEFPSGHVTAAAACAMFAWFLLERLPRLRFAPFIVPVIVGWNVVTTRAHYPIDVLGGFLVGSFVVYGIVASAAAMKRPRRGAQHRPALEQREGATVGACR